MSEERASMMEPAIEGLLEKVDSKFTLVTLSARRGRQINSYFNQLGEGLGAFVPPQVNSSSRKPLSIALEEIAAGKIVAVPLKDEGERDTEGSALASQSEHAKGLLGDSDSVLGTSGLGESASQGLFAAASPIPGEGTVAHAESEGASDAGLLGRVDSDDTSPSE